MTTFKGRAFGNFCNKSSVILIFYGGKFARPLKRKGEEFAFDSLTKLLTSVYALIHQDSHFKNLSAKMTKDGKAKREEVGADEEVFDGLTPQMSNELKERGLTFHETLGKQILSFGCESLTDAADNVVLCRITLTNTSVLYDPIPL